MRKKVIFKPVMYVSKCKKYLVWLSVDGLWGFKTPTKKSFNIYTSASKAMAICEYEEKKRRVI